MKAYNKVKKIQRNNIKSKKRRLNEWKHDFSKEKSYDEKTYQVLVQRKRNELREKLTKTAPVPVRALSNFC